ncbi:site-2 protease family protein [Alicyclobacillus dauci]|uniref:Site-2 protease family protein n=1 Tax=Alicyclobacillus dauci TaxID=1475485 RepID=A0ABY6Z923_9BACL|nr:site-2 protease family protein [Alicyclobacillus dauci]WAH39067.1 site-2 protease family protein [Alicyclobacillus dauci]
MFAKLSSPSYILTIFIVLFSLVVHEFAHAFVADVQGDKTARLNGRLTLNPLAHLDLLGIIMIVIASIGWARPVPINMNNFRKPRLSMILAVAAGPGSNLIIAILANLAAVLTQSSYVASALLQNIAIVNVSLFVLNIIPIPPLDGSQILRHMLPYKQAVTFSKLDVYGPFILLFLFIIPQFYSWVFGPITYSLDQWILSWFL